MFSRFAKQSITTARYFSTSKQNNFKVAVCGASGGIGQPLSLLLKINPLVSELNLYDIVHTPGVAADLSHIETCACVTAFNGLESLKDALKNADLIIVPAGIPRKPGMTRDDLFDKNANVVKTIAEAAVEVAPKAILGIITNPVNSCVPIACEVFKKAGKLDPKRIFGVSTLDIVRANTFVGDKLKVDPKNVNVTVIGGHSGVTIIPLFSRTTPAVKFTGDELNKITVRVQEAGTEVVKAKAGAGSATLSMAYAGARFGNSILRGLKGEPNVVECSYVQSNVCPEVEYFSTPIVLGKNGVESICPIGEINDYERELIKKAIPELKANIEKGKQFVQKAGSKTC